MDQDMFKPTTGMTCVHGLLHASSAIIPELDMIKLAQDLSYVVNQKQAKKNVLTSTQKNIRRILRDLKRLHQKNAVRASHALLQHDTEGDDDRQTLDDETMQPEEEEDDTAIVETMDMDGILTNNDDNTTFMNMEMVDCGSDNESVQDDDEDEDEIHDHHAGLGHLSGPLSYKPDLLSEKLLGHCTVPQEELIDHAMQHYCDKLGQHGFQFAASSTDDAAEKIEKQYLH
jgi:hypothetical protein